MTVIMPRLEEGRVYHRQEVEDYIGWQTGTSNFDVMKAHFPRSLDTFEHNQRGWRNGEEILLQYRVFTVEDALKAQIQSLVQLFMQHEAEWKRVDVISEMLQRGNTVYPVLMQQDDPQRRIIEGNHRAAALYTLECSCLPAFLAGYRNWFSEDELAPGFNVEDQIVLASLKDVFTFFRHATCIDQRGITMALLDSDHLRECDEALVARFRGQIVGAVTMTIKKGKPTLQTIYTLKQYRGKGVAYRLCIAALLRFRAAGVGEIFCDVQSEGTAEILARLERQRPDLRAMVKAHMDYSPGVGIEIDDDIDVLEE